MKKIVYILICMLAVLLTTCTTSRTVTSLQSMAMSEEKETVTAKRQSVVKGVAEEEKDNWAVMTASDSVAEILRELIVIDSQGKVIHNERERTTGRFKAKGLATSEKQRTKVNKADSTARSIDSTAMRAEGDAQFYEIEKKQSPRSYTIDTIIFAALLLSATFAIYRLRK